MIASFSLCRTIVQVEAVWMMKNVQQEDHPSSKFNRFKQRYLKLLERLASRTSLALVSFFLIVGLLLAGCFYFTGVDIFPKTDEGQAQVRLRLKTGTRLERTEEATQKLLQIAAENVGKENIDISSDLVGPHTSAYPVTPALYWTT